MSQLNIFFRILFMQTYADMKSKVIKHKLLNRNKLANTIKIGEVLET